MMKVLQVIDRLDIGGAEKVFLDQVRLLQDQPMDLGVMVLRQGGTWFSRIPEGLSPHVLGRKSKFSLTKLWELHRVCSKYDLVHAHMRHVYAYVRTAQLLFRGSYKLLIQDHLGVGSFDPVPWRLKGLFRPRYYISVDPQQLEWARRRIGLDPQQSFLLENQPLHGEGPQPLPGMKPSALLISNISEGKNLEFAIRLFQRRKEKLTIYGQVRQEPYYRKLKSLIRPTDQIKMITDGSPIPFELFDLGLHSSSRESGPLVLWEYLAHGLPFLAYPAGSVSAKIKPKFPMFFIDHFDLESWSQRLDQIRSKRAWPSLIRPFFQDHDRPKDYLNACLSIYHRVAY